MNKTQKKNLTVIGLAAACFVAGLLADNVWLFIAAYAIASFNIYKEAFFGIIHLQFLDENFLMVVASLAAIYCGEFHEAVGVILFYRVGEFFEGYAVNNSRESIADLMDIAPETATVIRDGKEETVFPEELEIGEIVVVRPGEKIPVDGTVVEGFSSLNTAALTGESLPQDVQPDSKVISGTINMSGLLKIKVDTIFEDSTVAKVLDLVENSASRKAHVEKFITKFAKYYTPSVVAAAILLAIFPPLLFGADLKNWIYVAAKFLVISCPCALVISVPLSLFAGIGAASKHGILIKGSNYLEALSKIDTVAFDKTGTLTEGKFEVSKIYPAEGNSEAHLLEVAAYGESFSTHPIAQSIVSKAGEIDQSRISDYEEIPGKGITARFDGKVIYCGNQRLMDDLSISVSPVTEPGSVVYVSENGSYLGAILVSDVIREESAETIKELNSIGIKNTVMLTGDRREIAEKVGEALGLSKVYAELLPGDKVNTLSQIISEKGGQKEDHNVVFVGDGINDAPVLALADVGVAMGAFGSDAAVEAADVVIMTDDISKLPTIIKIGRKTLRICKENIIFALGVKFLVLGLAPFGLVSMWAAIVADVGVAIVAILNAMRALKF